MILEPKHKNFKDEYKIKERVKKKIKYQAPYVCFSGSFTTLLSETSKLVTQSL